MTELETGLLGIITKYGTPAVIIACLTIFLIGILKYFGVFNKIAKENRKPIYFILNYVFGFGITAAYYAIFKIPFADYVAYSFVTASAVNLLYPLYENLKLRELLAKLGSFIVKVVAKRQVAAEAEKIKNKDSNEVNAAN